jgi:hypothetical protein
VSDVRLFPYPQRCRLLKFYSSQTILAQAKRDDDISALFEEISEVYSLITEDKRLPVIETKSMQDLFEKMADEIRKCADFIINYSEQKSFCESNSLCRRPPDSQCRFFAQ